MALVLAAGLGITGIAATAQAAPAAASTRESCRHETLHYFETFISATYYDGYNHLSTYRSGYECSECRQKLYPQNFDRIEGHDYEQTYYHDGKVESKCLGCHYSYYW